jgi:chromosome segregation ATPase
MNLNEAIKSITNRIESLDARLDLLSNELESINEEWKRDRAIHIRIDARAEALASIIEEMLTRIEVTPERFQLCLLERTDYFEDKKLLDMEVNYPELASHIDPRDSRDITTDKVLRTLFPQEPKG